MVEAFALTQSDPTFYADATQKQSFDHEYSAHSVVVLLSVALALCSSLEMVFLILVTFKQWKGLYFWSLTLCNYGVVLYTLGVMMGYWMLGPIWLGKVFCDCVGWVLMVVCQSLVLYSRLGLIVDSQAILDAVKWMIIFGATVICPAGVVFGFIRTYVPTVPVHKGFYYYEQVQMTYFTFQELIISFLYVWKTLAFLRSVFKANTRTMIWQLFMINVVIISMDVTLVCLQFLHYQLYQESVKGFVYSVKLKLELNILSKLVDLVPNNDTSHSMTIDVINSDGIVGQAQAEVRREMSQTEPLSVRLGSDDKGVVEANERDVEPEAKDSGSATRPLNNNYGIERVYSTQSRVSTRTAHREVDNWYADITRSIA